MINKTYKRIHNKYSTLFKFAFFLRYLLGIFFTSAVLFLVIPHFFDHRKKEMEIKSYLLESYGLKLIKYEDIKYNSLPKPKLEIKNAELTIKSDLIGIKVSSLSVYPKLAHVYNSKNFRATKIVLNKNKMILPESDFVVFTNYIFKLKNRIIFDNLYLKIKRKDSPLINIKKIYFSNYGFKKNQIRGELFENKFKVLINDNFNSINFKLLDAGINADIIFNSDKKKPLISGLFKSKVLNSNLKFNFDYDGEKIKIYKSYFRNKGLAFSNNSTISFLPFFSLISNFEVENINVKLLKNLNLEKILSKKTFIKKLNSQNNINFNSKKFTNSSIDNLNLKIDLAYGRLFYRKKISFSKNSSTCQGYINLTREYPVLYFDCSLVSFDKKKLMKLFSIKYKNKKEKLELNVKGNINILNNKINFQKILVNKTYESNREDLNYFKKTFENILFNKNFLNIFNSEKIKQFILEIS